MVTVSMSPNSPSARSRSGRPQCGSKAAERASGADLIKVHLRALICAYQDLHMEGVSLPALAQALGLEAATNRATGPTRPWTIRPESNMAIVADRLEQAGAEGLSERELVNALLASGRLSTAANARRSVHWSVSELARRTSCVVRASADSGGRWYCLGSFAEFRATRRPKGPHTL